MHLFITLITIKMPIIFVPPLYGTNLHVSYNTSYVNNHIYCSKTAYDDILWVNTKYFFPPMYNCLFNLLTVNYDKENDRYKSIPNVNISIHDFGGEESVKFIDDGIMGYHIIESFQSLIQKFKNEGYEMRKNLFAAPYDWRFAVLGLDEFYVKLKKLIEEDAYEKNDRQKVTLFGFSTGGFILQHFLSEIIDEKWKEKYIHKAVFLAPSWGGAGLTVYSFMEKVFPPIPVIKSNDLSAMIQSMPVIMQHFPNWEIFGNFPVVRGPGEISYNASQVGELLINLERLTGDNIYTYKKIEKHIKKAPKPIGVPTTIIYNSGLDTDFGLRYKNWNKPPVMVPVRGDGTIMARGVEYACKNWPASDETPILCIDMARDDHHYKHSVLATNPYVHHLVYEHTAKDTHKNLNSTRTLIECPYTEVIDNKFVYRYDLRNESKKSL